MVSYGFVKVSCDVQKAIPEPKQPTSQSVAELPSSKFAQDTLKKVTREFPEKVLFHSLRVYQYSVAIIRDYFPSWDLDLETLFVTALPHDIGTTEKNMRDTKLSFEFYGGILSREWDLEQINNRDYADVVAEVIIRHQDLGESGFIFTLGLIIQISTILDNVGHLTHLIHPETLDAVNKKYPRDGWSECFVAALDNENKQKPWGGEGQR
ncbi:cyanamide hydratase [Basidiobolus meristosporus CBS 931.73]|uniref:Cyanamide hydratase n=1 Tax=Basidiobolus meristosporus CBS 931.73 TaxID=1314790 RepID=A0A1Y1VQX2_9FUNG|nr:cyanamide hydratase [Basidiobolus meristosporus CBS 931.73]|eukprot:ORX63426.1 cyanamide hydratase [Basidiobolus meristosporus CBS 931.73]